MADPTEQIDPQYFAKRNKRLIVMAAFYIGAMIFLFGVKSAWDVRDLHQAVVEKKDRVFVNSDPAQAKIPSAYNLTVKFKTKFGKEKICTATVDRFFFGRVNEGTEVAVLYNANRPEHHELYGIKLKEKTFPYQYFLIAAGAIVMAIGWSLSRKEG